MGEQADYEMEQEEWRELQDSFDGFGAVRPQRNKRPSIWYRLLMWFKRRTRNL
jgi:hypothetical protein